MPFCNRVDCPNQLQSCEPDGELNECAETQAVVQFQQLYHQYKRLGYERMSLIQQQEQFPQETWPD